MSTLSSNSKKTFRCTREDLRCAPLPEATDTWRPVAHYDLAVAVIDESRRVGFVLKDEAYAMTKDRFGVFGVLNFSSENETMNRAVGFRHDNKKHMALSLTIGARIMVCDNMCFSGDRVVSWKHTSRFELELAVPTLFNGIEQKFQQFEAAMERLSGQELGSSEARSIIIDAASRGAIASCDIMPVVCSYEAPVHEPFKPRTRWSLYNSFTEVAKKFQPAKYDHCFRVLAQMFDLGAEETVEVPAEVLA